MRIDRAPDSGDRGSVKAPDGAAPVGGATGWPVIAHTVTSITQTIEPAMVKDEPAALHHHGAPDTSGAPQSAPAMTPVGLESRAMHGCRGRLEHPRPAARRCRVHSGLAMAQPIGVRAGPRGNRCVPDPQVATRAGLRAAQRTCGRSPPTGSPCGSSTSGTTTPAPLGSLRRIRVRPDIDQPIAIRRASAEEPAFDLGLGRHRGPDPDLDAVPFALRHPAEDRHDQIVGFGLRDSLFGARNRSRAARNSSNVAVAPSVGLHRGPACARTPSSWPVTVVAAMSVDLARRHRQFREITRREPARHWRTHGNHAASAAAVG